MRWWRALNPAIYLISLLPGAMVFVLNGGMLFHPLPFFMAVIGVCLIQHAINVLNDHTDWKRGADSEKYDSWVLFHEEKLPVVRIHGFLSLVAGASIGILSLVLVDKIEILAAALPLVALGYYYNAGEKPLSYTPYAEWATGICYGPGVFGCLWWMESGSFSLAAAGGVVAFAALATSILFSHQIPQVLTDSVAGKLSYAVRYGADNAGRAARILLRVFFVATFLATVEISLPLPIKVLFFLGAFVGIVNGPSNRISPRLVLTYSTIWISVLVLFTSFTRVIP